MAAVFGLAALTACAAALAKPVRVEKDVLLAHELRSTNTLRAYGSHRLLAIGARGIARIGADGSLDRSFGQLGGIATDAADVIVDPRGRILLASSVSPPGDPGNEDARVTRLLPNGKPDHSFGSKGVVYVDLGGRYDSASALALDRRGRVVVGGGMQTRPEDRGGSDMTPALARLLPNGRLDRSFGNRGIALPPAQGESGILSLGIDGSGAIVAEGEAHTGTAIWRLKRSGTLDRHFGENGLVTIEGRGQPDEYDREEALRLADRVGVRPDGRIVLAGTGSTSGEQPEYRLVALRLHRDGRLDRAYGRNGYATARLADWTFIESVSFLPDGGLVAVGNSVTRSQERSDVGVISLDRNGRLNRRLIPRGKMTVHLPGWGRGDDVALQRGRVSVLGEIGESTKRWLIRIPLS